MLIFYFSNYNRELMSYIVRVDRETGKYIVKSGRYPGLETSGDSFDGAIEEFEKCASGSEPIEILNKKALPTANEIPSTIVKN